MSALSELLLTSEDTGLTRTFSKDYSAAKDAAEGNAEFAAKLAEFGFEKGAVVSLSEPVGVAFPKGVSIRKATHFVARYSSSEGGEEAG